MEHKIYSVNSLTWLDLLTWKFKLIKDFKRYCFLIIPQCCFDFWGELLLIKLVRSNIKYITMIMNRMKYFRVLQVEVIVPAYSIERQACIVIQSPILFLCGFQTWPLHEPESDGEEVPPETLFSVCALQLWR